MTGPSQNRNNTELAPRSKQSPIKGNATVTEAGRKLRRGVQLWKVAGAVFKSETYRFLRLIAPTDEELAEGREWPHGFVHIPKGTTAEWMKQLPAIVRNAARNQSE